MGSLLLSRDSTVLLLLRDSMGSLLSRDSTASLSRVRLSLHPIPPPPAKNELTSNAARRIRPAASARPVRGSSERPARRASSAAAAGARRQWTRCQRDPHRAQAGSSGPGSSASCDTTRRGLTVSRRRTSLPSTPRDRSRRSRRTSRARERSPRSRPSGGFRWNLRWTFPSSPCRSSLVFWPRKN